MSAKQRKKCAYNYCMLPKNNNRYWAQLVFYIIAFCFIALDAHAFTFLSLFIYVIPIVLDLLFAEIKNGFLTKLKYFFLVANIILALICIVGQFGFFVDEGTNIKVVETSMILANTQIPKNLLLFLLLVDLVIPVIMVFGTPNQKSAQAILFIQDIQEKRGSKK